ASGNQQFIVALAGNGDGAPLHFSVLNNPGDVAPVHLVDDVFRDTQIASQGLTLPFGPALKGDFHSHIGKNSRIEIIKADADFYGRFLPVGSRNDRDDFGRNLPIGVRIKRRDDMLARLNPIDITFVYIDFDFERIHIDKGANTSPSETTTGGNGR